MVTLCEQFYPEIVKDLIRKEFPSLNHSTGHIDDSSKIRSSAPIQLLHTLNHAARQKILTALHHNLFILAFPTSDNGLRGGNW